MLLLSTLNVLVGVGVSSKSWDCLGFIPEKLTQTSLTRDQRISHTDYRLNISHVWEFCDTGTQHQISRIRLLWYLEYIVWSLSDILCCVPAVFVFGCNRLECDYSEYSPVSREGILIKFQLQQIVHQIGSGARDAIPHIINQSPSFKDYFSPIRALLRFQDLQPAALTRIPIFF